MHTLRIWLPHTNKDRLLYSLQGASVAQYTLLVHLFYATHACYTSITMRNDYKEKRLTIAKRMGWELNTLEKKIASLYVDGLSASQISEMIQKKTNQRLSAKTLQRIIKPQGVLRNGADAFRLAVSQKRVNFAYKAPEFKARKKHIGVRVRFEILTRDGFKCVLCGQNGGNDVLEVDHIIAKVSGGTDELSNLRTLCNRCNQGKRLFNEEK